MNREYLLPKYEQKFEQLYAQCLENFKNDLEFELKFMLGKQAHLCSV